MSFYVLQILAKKTRDFFPVFFKLKQHARRSFGDFINLIKNFDVAYTIRFAKFDYNARNGKQINISII